MSQEKSITNDNQGAVGSDSNDGLGAHWDALLGVATTRESCIAIEAIQTQIAELEDQIRREGRMISAQAGLRASLRSDRDRYLKGLECLRDSFGKMYDDQWILSVVLEELDLSA